MQKAELIRELLEERRNLEAGIRKQHAALKGLDAYLSYLRENGAGYDQEILANDLRFSLTDDAEPSNRSMYEFNRRVVIGGGDPGRMILAREVREAVERTEGEFTQQEITQMIVEKHPDEHVNPSSVYNAIAKMERRGEVRRVREGVGSEPHVFEKVSRDDSSQEIPEPEESPVSG